MPVHAKDFGCDILEDQKQKDLFSSNIARSRSLSYYNVKSFKAVIPQILAATIAAFSHLVVGMSLSYSAILLPQLEESVNSTDANAIPITKTEESWIASSYVISVGLGSVITGFIIDATGRLNVLKLAAIPFLIGWIVMATATNVPMLLCARLITGFAAVCCSIPATVYITEIAQPDLRGSLISLIQSFASLGIMIIYLKGWFLNWRTVAWLTNIYTLLSFIMLMFIPESPAWLVSKDRIEQARKSLNWIHRYHSQPTDKSQSFAELQLVCLQKEYALEQELLQSGSRKLKLKMFFHPTCYKPMLILSGLFFFQQFSGIYITLFYAVTFFEDVRSTINPYLASVCIAVVRLVMTVVNPWLMKRFHRRDLISVSAVGMAVCMAISGFFTKQIQDGDNTYHWVPVAMILFYIVASIVGVMSIPWTMTAEVFPLEIRGVANSIAFAVANLMMFVAVQSYYTLVSVFGGSSGVQYFFAAVSVSCFVYNLILLPETHKKELKDIETYFLKNTTYYSLSCKKK